MSTHSLLIFMHPWPVAALFRLDYATEVQWDGGWCWFILPLLKQMFAKSNRCLILQMIVIIIAVLPADLQK